MINPKQILNYTKYMTFLLLIMMFQSLQASGFLRTQDTKIVDESGQEVILRGMGLGGARARIPALVSERPASIPMSGKLLGSEYAKKLGEVATRLQGTNAAYYVGDDNAIDGGRWPRGYFNAFSGTIGGGTSQIQKNIIGERVLGLPKPPRPE